MQCLTRSLHVISAWETTVHTSDLSYGQCGKYFDLSNFGTKQDGVLSHRDLIIFVLIGFQLCMPVLKYRVFMKHVRGTGQLHEFIDKK
jgi:hypothetical protein